MINEVYHLEDQIFTMYQDKVFDWLPSVKLEQVNKDKAYRKLDGTLKKLDKSIRSTFKSN